VTSEQYTLGERLFRAVLMAFIGAGVGLLLALLLVRRGWIEWNPLPSFTIVGAGLGGAFGFWLSDYAWKRVLRIVMPFSNWP
jgi:hypothetical protein